MRDIPYGYCQCSRNCGEKTELYRYSDKRTGVKKGEPRKYVLGHGRHRQGPEYIEQDLGYETPCWVWQGSTNKGGYSRTTGNRYGHIAYYEKYVGPIPEGMTLDHICHNAVKDCEKGPECPHRACVNPSHLVPKPTRANTRAGRRPKLTLEDVREIRETPRKRGSGLALARKFGVHPVWISSIRNGKGWPTD